MVDLAITKTVSDATPNVGDQITFTVLLSNQSPGAATGVQVSDLLPAGLSFVSASPSQGSYNNATGLWDVGTVNSGDSPTLSVTALVVNAAEQTNTATISAADQFDPDMADNTGSATATPQRADLSVTKTVSDPTPNVGDQITFTVSLSNQGPDTATGVQVSDLLPAGLSFVSASSSQGSYNNITGLWSVGTVSSGDSPFLTVTATVVSPAAQTNIGTISADQFDPDMANNTGSATETPQADLAITKTVSDATPNVGDQITFTVLLSNQSPGAATGVQVSDLLPAGLSFVSASSSQGSYNNATGLWDVGTVNSGDSPTLSVTAMVVNAAEQTNTATISAADQFDPDMADNTGSATATPQRADLSVTKTVSDATPNVGDQITFTVSLSNQGPDTATGVQVSDLLPAGLSFVSASSSQGSYNNITGLWSVGTVSSGDSPFLTVTATVVSPAAQTNIGTISADQFDPDMANNTGSATETPQNLSIVYFVNGQDADSPTGPHVAAGSTVTYTYVVTSTYNVPLANVAVSDDKLGPIVSFTGDSNGNGLLDLTETWTYTTTATAVAGQQTNVGTVTAQDVNSPPGTTVTDSNPANYFGDVPAIQIVKFVNGQDADNPTGPHVAAGSTATFTYVVTNTGNVALANVAVTDDKLGPIASFTGDTNTNGLLDLTETWTYTTTATALAGQQTNIGTVTAQDVNSPPGTTVTDDNPANYFGDAPAINIVKFVNGQDADSPTGPHVAAGSTATFTYVVTNTGNVALANVAVSDDKLGPIASFTGDTNTNGLLDLTETWTYTKTATAQAGQQTNTGTVTAQDVNSPPGTTVTDSNPANYFGDTNDPPRAVVLSNVHAPIAENASTALPIKISDIAVIDDGRGTNLLSLAGADAALFQITGGDLWLKAGAKLDFETNPVLDVTVRVNDPGVGGAVDAFRSLAIKITDVIETINGNNNANTLIGTTVGETINGFAGNDRIVGNGGNDRMVGGLGRDIMTGGPGNDFFVFTSIRDSAPGQSGLINNSTYGAQAGQGLRDIITDFTHGQDRIDLSAIDANARVAGNQAFSWHGTGNFVPGRPGWLIERIYNPAGTANDKTVIYGDVNGDAMADFQIELTGLKHLVATDFVL